MSEIIKNLRKNTGLSQAQLAAKLHVHQTAISLWEKDEYTPNADGLAKLAEFFNVTVDYILGSPSKSNILRIPVFGIIKAGIPMEAIEDIQDYEEAPVTWATGGKQFFALKIKGDSMYPEYREGDVIIFLKRDTCENGEDCAVLINGSDATFKRIERQHDGIILRPLNPEYASRHFTDGEIQNVPIRILGTFWELRRTHKQPLIE